VERHPPGTESSRANLPYGGICLASQFHTSRNYPHPMKAELGPKAATTATAHKIARVFYAIVTKQVEYDETIWAARDAQRHK
jgi:hypothetical protein